ncbi:MAG: phage head morphogenesis protein [Nitrospirae bacterium]|nr:phage head morphogenesis protein [Nitrospirota bacterium]
MADATFKPLPFEEAIAFFSKKILLSPEEYRSLIEALRQLAFTVSGIAEADIIDDIYRQTLKGLTDGISFNDFKKALIEKVSAAWGAAAASRLDTIFRTNIQSAYQAGHYKRQREVASAMPYWQYVAVMDSRTRPGHAAMNGKVFRYDSEFWKKNYPPNGFNCRCTVVALTEGQIKKLGLPVQTTAQDIADPGFAVSPEDGWNPDLSKYPDWLKEKVA